MSDTKRHKTLLVGVPHAELFKAYKNWCAYCEEAGLRGQAARFESFVGFEPDWQTEVEWVLPRFAEKLRLLNTPHYHTMIKARKANRNFGRSR